MAPYGDDPADQAQIRSGVQRLRRLVLRIGPLVLVLPWVVLGIISPACRQPTPREVTRVASGDGRVDAVVVERLTDATVPTPFEVYVVPRGTVPSDEHLILRIDKSSAPQVEWLHDNELSVRCGGARVWHFQNFASVSASVRMPGESFWSGTVMLACGVGRYGDSRYLSLANRERLRDEGH
jgi:hypothetical protein